MYDVVFTCTPGYALSMPNYALSLLKGELGRAFISAKIVYSNHRMYTFFREDAKKGLYTALNTIDFGWELLFSHYTGFSVEKDAYEAIKAAGEKFPGNKEITYVYENWERIYKAAGDFLEQEADYLLSFNPKIIGASLFYQQFNVTVALFNVIKRKRHEVITVVGGFFCNPPNSRTLVKYAKNIDYVTCGEGDFHIAKSYPLLIQKDLKALEQLYPYYDYKGKEPLAVYGKTPDISEIALPEYSDYASQLLENDFKIHTRLPLIYEASRGCWWGRCKFCGLNWGHSEFRTKSPERIIREIKALEEKYRPSEIALSDNILSMDLINSLPDGDQGSDKRYLFAEVKSNLTEEQIRRLKVFGFHSLQPGIESLQDDILKLMDKGVRAIKQVEFIKHCRRYGIEVTYNIMYGFYEEKEEWYEEMVSRFPLIHHLSPPFVGGRMYLAKGSPFTEELMEIAPESVGLYENADAAFPAIPEYLDVVVAKYDSPKIEPTGRTHRILQSAILEWKEAFKNNAWLYYEEDERGDILITDTRSVAVSEHHRLSGITKDIFMKAYSTTSIRALHEYYDVRDKAENVDEVISWLIDNKLMLRIGDEVLSLATPEDCWEYGERIWDALI